MAKALTQLGLFAVCFFSCWFVLSTIGFTRLFHVEELSRENEHKIGTYVVEAFEQGASEVGADSGRAVPVGILRQLCSANGIVDSSITLHIVQNGEVNAFSLPDRHLVVYTGLINYCANADELAGVMAHEVAHMERHHVMKKMMKEIGLGMLFTIAGGGATREILRQSVQTLSSTAFDREQEREADSVSVRYLLAARVDPKPLANFLFRLSSEKTDLSRSFEWISTHPASSDRAAEILSLTKDRTVTTRPVVGDSVWNAYKEFVRSIPKH